MSLLTLAVCGIAAALLISGCTPLDVAKAAAQTVAPSDPSPPPYPPVSVQVDVGGITVTTGGAETALSPATGTNPGVFAVGQAESTPVCEPECFGLEEKAGMWMPIDCP